MRSIAIVGMLVLSAGFCCGQQLRVEQALPAQQCYDTAAFAGSSAGPAVPPSEAADHVRKAAAHLDAAGMKAEADWLRRLAKERLAGRCQQVLVHIKILELSHAKLKAVGLGGGWPASGHKNPSAAASVHGIASPEQLQKLEAMREDGHVRVLSEPTMVTVSGRAASFHSGGSIPWTAPQGQRDAVTKFVDYGTSVALLPLVIEDNRIHLQLRVEFSEPAEDFGEDARAVQPPPLRRRRMETECDLQPGQTCAIAGLVQTRIGKSPKADDSQPGKNAKETREDFTTVFLVTPELVEPTEPLRASSGPLHQGCPAPVPTTSAKPQCVPVMTGQIAVPQPPMAVPPHGPYPIPTPPPAR